MTLYVALFWLDSAQTIVHKFASHDKDKTISFARDYVVALNIKDAGYETFVLQEIGQWNGSATANYESESGKLLLLQLEVKTS